MMNPLFSNEKAKKMIYGGDYNPEQWSEDIWVEDANLMQEAGVSLISLGIFSWSKLEPKPGVYNFDWLDRVIDLLHAHNVYVNLATATASPPPWFSRQHPDSLPVDEKGTRYNPGSRQQYCPNNQAYKTAAETLAGKLAERYREHPGVVMWHINNEYGCHNSECYCETCTAVFRTWLQARYQTIEALNDAWGTAFWSMAYGEWEEIALPNRTISFYNPAHMLDYRRFMNDSLLNIYRAEIEAVQKTGAKQPITTNFLFGNKSIDYFQWAQEGDAVAIDLYPDPCQGDSAWREAAFWYDLTRSQGGKRPFLVMEQSTTQVNWRNVNQLKPPGMMRALSYQAIARGADGVMFFQWRASRAGAEKYHSAMVPHGGVENSRVFAEVKQLGEELQGLTAVTGSQTPAQVGILFSYENVWALELDSKPAEIDALEVGAPWYQALLSHNVPLDIVHPDNDLSHYQVLVAPLLYQLTETQAESLKQFVANGGTLIMTYFSGIVDEREHIWLGGYPALLQDMLGVVVEEWQPFMPDERNEIQLINGETTANCTHWADLLHTTSAETVAVYTKSFFAGRPAITRNQFGKGTAYYLGTRPDMPFLVHFLGDVLNEHHIRPPFPAPPNVEITTRVNGDVTYVFAINHSGVETAVNLQSTHGTNLLTGETVGGQIQMAPYDVLIIEKKKN